MLPVVIAKPYRFIPPRLNRLVCWVVRRMLPRNLRRDHGITLIECVGEEKLRASLAQGHGILLASNHCRPCDPMVLDTLAAAVRRPFYVIASWHVFLTSWVQRFLLPRIGGFSVYREGMDRDSLKCAIQTVAEGRHPLVIFVEGIVTRCNDRLVNFMEGPAFMARAAARQRPTGKVVIHPVFIRYFFEGNLEASVLPVLTDIESRLTWQPQTNLPLRERFLKVGGALLALKEIEYLGAVRQGPFRQRLQTLLDHLLVPLENQWTAGRHDGDPMARVKRLRAAIVPDLVKGEIAEADRAARWRHLADVYLVQQLHCYPGGYTEDPAPERLLETVERYEEDLTDRARAHPPIRAVITVGDAIEVSAARDRSAEGDPVTTQLRQAMEGLLESSKTHRRPLPNPDLR